MACKDCEYCKIFTSMSGRYPLCQHPGKWHPEICPAVTNAPPIPITSMPTRKRIGKDLVLNPVKAAFTITHELMRSRVGE